MTPNISMTIKGKDLVITVKDAVDGKTSTSKSGKSSVIASTQGNTDISSLVPGGKLGLNIYRSNPDYVKPEPEEEAA
jgi:hypothetical protein